MLHDVESKRGTVSCTPERRYANLARLYALCYSIPIGKSRAGRFWEGLLFQAVAQVNPIAQNTFLLLIALCSFLASGFISFFLYCFNPLVDCSQQLFLFSS